MVVAPLPPLLVLKLVLAFAAVCAQEVLPPLLPLDGSVELPAPVSLHHCLLPEAVAKRLLHDGFVGVVVGQTGDILSLKCLAHVLPELKPRPFHDRFLLDSAFDCKASSEQRGAGGGGNNKNSAYMLCTGSVGTFFLHAAFSRAGPAQNFSIQQYLSQTWLVSRCTRYTSLVEARNCKLAFRTFAWQYQDLGDLAAKWRTQMSHWLALDSDIDWIVNADPAAFQWKDSSDIITAPAAAAAEIMTDAIQEEATSNSVDDEDIDDEFDIQASMGRYLQTEGVIGVGFPKELKGEG
jgi:hypothetical protein